MKTISRRASTKAVASVIKEVEGTATARTADVADVARLRKIWQAEFRDMTKRGGNLISVELRPKGVANSYRYPALGTFIRLTKTEIVIFRAPCNGNRNLRRAVAILPAGADPGGHLIGRTAVEDRVGFERVTYSW